MRDAQPPPEDPDGPTPGDPGRLGTTPAPLLLSLFLAGLVLGWLVRPASVWWGVTTPRVEVVQVAVLYLAAAILGWVARVTRTAVRRRARLPAYQAVNRLVLAKACAIVGAVVAGGYCGHALSWVGIGSELADERAGASVVAAAGALLSMAAALALERACRVGGDGHEP